MYATTDVADWSYGFVSLPDVATKVTGLVPVTWVTTPWVTWEVASVGTEESTASASSSPAQPTPVRPTKSPREINDIFIVKETLSTTP
ncbi:hypothetical protein ACLESO_29695 [Pyxidicoccus sp. 3LG]